MTEVLRAAAPVASTISPLPPRRAAQAHRLSTLLLRTAKAMETRIESALAKHGLSMAKLGVLRQLAEEQRPLPLTRIAERVSCVKSNVTQLVDRLEADALVARVDDPSDRRSVRAAITEAGCRACDAGNAIVDAIERDLVAALGQADYDRLRDALEELRVRA